MNDALAVLSNDQGTAQQGLYIWRLNRWFYILDQRIVSDAVKEGRSVEVYFNLTSTVEVRGTVYRNGQLTDLTEVGPSANFVVVGPPLVSTVNSQPPDEAGNIDVDIITLGGVKSVNDHGPDDQGNVYLPQMANYSVSVPNEPEAGSTVYYQELVDPLSYLGGEANVKLPPSADIQFPVFLDGQSIGTIDFTAGQVTGSVQLTVDPISPGSVLEIIAPEDLHGAAIFSFVLMFARI